MKQQNDFTVAVRDAVKEWKKDPKIMKELKIAFKSPFTMQEFMERRLIEYKKGKQILEKE